MESVISGVLPALILLTAYMGHQPLSAVYICFCVHTRHAGFVREVPKDSERDFIDSLN